MSDWHVWLLSILELALLLGWGFAHILLGLSARGALKGDRQDHLTWAAVSGKLDV